MEDRAVLDDNESRCSRGAEKFFNAGLLQATALPVLDASEEVRGEVLSELKSRWRIMERALRILPMVADIRTVPRNIPRHVQSLARS
jgi:hypothetical protein